MSIIDISIDELRGFVYGDFSEELGAGDDTLYFQETVVGNERAFVADIGSGYHLQFLTSIGADEETVRDEGSDAMRLLIVDENGNIVSSESHTKRKPKYREKIRRKSSELLECPECLSQRRVASGEYGRYFFCTNNSCEYTESLES